MLRLLATVGLVAAAGGIFALWVRPAQSESAAFAEEIHRPAAGERRTGSAAPAERARLETALRSLRRTAAPVPPPAGIEERKPGSFGGRLPWSEVQGFLAWAAAQKGTVESIEVQAADEKEMAECRLVLAPEGPR